MKPVSEDGMHHGKACRSIFSMLEVTSPGSCLMYDRPILEYVSERYAVFYINLVVLTLIRRISAMISQNIVDAATRTFKAGWQTR